MSAVSDMVSLCGLEPGLHRCLDGGCLQRCSLQTYRDTVTVWLCSSAGQPLRLWDSGWWGHHSRRYASLTWVCEPCGLAHMLDGPCGQVCEYWGHVHTQLGHFSCHLKTEKRGKLRYSERRGREDSWIITRITEFMEQIVWTSWETDKNLGCVTVPQAPLS